MFVTRCVECNHEELTVNPECSCGCHTPAPQPPPVCCDPSAPIVKCCVCGADVHTCERTEPVDNDYRCPAHGNGVELNAGEWVCSDACGYERMLAGYVARIAALEAQLAETQERLAMAVEALRDAQKWATRWAQTTEHRDPNANDYGPYNQHPRGYAICPIPDWEVKQKRDDYAYALAATAASVAQHAAEVEQRGANQMLDRIRGALQNWPDQGCDEVIGRAVDEIVAKELDRLAEELESVARGGAGVLAYRIAASKCRFRATELRGRGK